MTRLIDNDPSRNGNSDDDDIPTIDEACRQVVAVDDLCRQVVELVERHLDHEAARRSLGKYKYRDAQVIDVLFTLAAKIAIATKAVGPDDIPIDATYFEQMAGLAYVIAEPMADGE